MNDDADVGDIFDNLRTPNDIAIYIKEVLEYGDAALTAAAIGNVTRFIGMARISENTGLPRESLYRMFSEKGNPRLSNIIAVLKSIGLKLSVETLENCDQKP